MGRIGTFLLPFIFLALICAVVVMAEVEPELFMPGGGDMDFNLQVVNCYGLESKPAQARWEDWYLEADYLEYDQKKGSIKGEGRVKVAETGKPPRILTCNDVLTDLKRETVTARQAVFRSGDDMELRGTEILWDRKNETFTATGGKKELAPVELRHKEWQITGSKLVYRLKQEVIVFQGPVNGVSGDDTFQAGKVVYDRKINQIYLTDRAVLRQGKNEITAPEITYDLHTKKMTLGSGTLFKSYLEE